MKETVYTRFLYSIIRHIISGLAFILVHRGWVEVELANKFTDSAAMDITAGVVALGISLYFSYKDKIWEFVKTNIAKVLPPASTMETVVKVSKNVENKKEVAQGDLSSLDLESLKVRGNA